MDDQLFIAPRNAMTAPAERHVRRWPGSHEVPVLARLEWSSSVQVVPGVVVRSPQTRMTWLARKDVRTELREPGTADPWPST